MELVFNKNNVRNLYYGSTEFEFECEINHPTYGWIPFTASENDTMEYGKKLFQDIQNGVYGEPQTKTVKVSDDKVI